MRRETSSRPRARVGRAPEPPLALAVLAAVLLAGPPVRKAVASAQEAPASEPVSRTLPYPPAPDPGIESLPARAQAEKKAAAETGVPERSFRFADRLPESGITFVHRIVDDAGRCYKAVHYDHGNGLAVADVDGDDLLDLYFLTQLGSNELWRNLGGGRFEQVTGETGLALADKVSVSASFADTDNDGDPDLYVTTVAQGNHFFENRGKGRFVDATASSGLGYTGHSSGVVFFDYNRDGLLDVYLANVGRYTTDVEGRGGYHVGLGDAFSGHHHPDRYESSRLYENRGGNRFADVTEERGLADDAWTGDAAFADLNGDGYPDLYVLNMQGDDRYYENRGGERFVERTDELFPRTPWGSMGVDFFDSDGDGRLDLIITDMHSDMSQEVGPEKEKAKAAMRWSDEHLQGGADNIFGNALYRQTAPGKFEEVSDPAGVETYWPWGLSTGDLDADGDCDLFVANSMNFPFRYQPNSLLLNDGARFHERAFVLGVEPRRDGATHTPWFEIDCSNPGESVCPGGDQARQFCRGLEGRVQVLGTLGTRASAILDLENDGDLDLVTNEFNAAPQVLVSDLAQSHEVHWLAVELVGTRSNRDGLGATVRVEVGDETLTEYHDGKSGYLSQSSMPLYFGLGEHGAAGRITVTWPSGAEQTLDGPIRANRRIEIVEPEPEPAAEAPPGPAGRR